MANFETSIHIEAKPEDIAETVILPGDPLRTRHKLSLKL